MAGSYRQLKVWQKAMELVKETYRLTSRLPREERYTLSDQLRRAAVSIPSNIAEGYGRSTTKDYVRFLSIARGSKYEVETQLLICVMLGYLSEEEISDATKICDEIGKMLTVILTKLSPDPNP